MTPDHLDLTGLLLERHHPVLRCLGLLSLRIPDGWCIVGGLMVMMAGHSVGAADKRSSETKDGDIVIDVVADPPALARVFRELNNLGYEMPPEAFDDPRIARSTVRAGVSTVDVLGPDDAPSDLLELESGIRSIAIPGGRRALQLAKPVRVTYAQDAYDVDLRTPDLFGAIAVKGAAALDEATRQQERHIQDVAFLLSAVPDPVEAAELLRADVDLVRRLVPLLEAAESPAWRYLDDDARLRALATLDFITG